nr:hypothetical protein Iba_chr06dCG9060 [Ipomoea batatas]GME09751.1 hypothetical protein Iba_scaffold9108CG0260 [Ipomoea batatas]
MTRRTHSDPVTSNRPSNFIAALRVGVWNRSHKFIKQPDYGFYLRLPTTGTSRDSATLSTPPILTLFSVPRPRLNPSYADRRSQANNPSHHHVIKARDACTTKNWLGRGRAALKVTDITWLISSGKR